MSFANVFTKGLSVFILLFIAVNQCIADEKWPEIKVYKELASQSVKIYRDLKLDYKCFLPNNTYSPFDDFMNWGRDLNYDSVPKDASGIITGKNGKYNPCTIAQYSLILYGKFLLGTGSKRDFLHQVDFLIKMIEDDGSLRYYYDFSYYCMRDKYFKSGWCSALVCGHLLSLCAKAYRITENKKYCEAAKKVLKFLTVPISDDGVIGTLEYLDPSLKDYVIFEEYPTIPQTYTLNGYMFTLVGIYDWSCIDSDTQDEAKKLFQKGIKTLIKIIPYYDIGGFTAYDLSHITLGRNTPHIGVPYHRYHIVLCKIMFDITKNEVFDKYYKLWASYVD